ncbi:CD48 antigen-like isoform X2 [Heptranchias perlo]
MVAATGTSVQFSGTDEGFTDFYWEFSNSSKSFLIIEYAKNVHSTIFEKYVNRVEFSRTDGSFMLKDVHEADTGNYKMAVDLDPKKTKILSLTVIDPLSTPSISSNCSSKSSTVVLSCMEQRGRASSVLWTRRGAELPANQHYWLSDGNRTLTIWNAKESDIGYYTCSVANPVSRNVSSYQLSIKCLESKPRARHGLIAAVLFVGTLVILSGSFLTGGRKPASNLEGRRNQQINEMNEEWQVTVNPFSAGSTELGLISACLHLRNSMLLIDCGIG